MDTPNSKKNEVDDFLEFVDKLEKNKKDEEARRFAEEIGEFTETEPLPDVSPEEYKEWWLKHISKINKDKNGKV